MINFNPLSLFKSKNSLKMRIHLVFNYPDKPDNMGQMHIVEDMAAWLLERSEILPDAEVSTDETKLFFTKEINGDGKKVKGYAILTKVDDDFKNV